MKPLHAIAIVAGIAAAAAGGWFWGGTPGWRGVTILSGIGWCFLVAGAVKEKALRTSAPWLGGALLAWGAWLAIGFLFAKSMIHLDNFTPGPVRVQVDGKPWAECAPGSTQVRALRRGTYDLHVVSADGTTLDRRSARIDGGTVYVLNAGGAMKYYRGVTQYGKSFAVPMPETEIRDPWFRTDADDVFVPPPESMRTRNSDGANRLYLRRETTPPTW